jgi:type IV pilus assembly protein PilM
MEINSKGMSSAIKNAPAAMVGLDIGSDYIKVAEAKFNSRSGITITGLGIAKTPQGAIENELIVNPQLLGEVIKGLLNESGIKTKKVVSSVAGQSRVVVRVIEVPKMSGAELANNMRYEVERQVPFSPTDIEMDYQPISAISSDPASQTMEVFLAVAQKGLLDLHVQSLQAAGLQPVAVDVESLSAGRSLVNAVSGSDISDDITAIISIGSTNTEIGIFEKGELTFPSPPIGIAGKSFTLEISEALGISPEEAEITKKEYANVDLGAFGNMPAEGQTASFDTSYSEIPNKTPFDMPEPAASADLSDLQGADNQFDGLSFDVDSAPASSEILNQPIPAQASDLDIISEPKSSEAEPDYDFSDLSGISSAPTVAPSSAAPVTGGADGDMSHKVFNAISSVLVDLVNEIRRSIEYYNIRYSKMPTKIIIFGGTANIPNLDKFMESELGIPVEVANPLGAMEYNLPGHSSQYIKDMAPSFPVCIGLAIRDMVG